MVRLNFRNLRHTLATRKSKTHSEAVDFAGGLILSLGVTSNGGPTDRPRLLEHPRPVAQHDLIP